MQRRRLMPNPLADVRWGYIDRFETNPYWMPALAVTVAFVAATLVATQRWPEPTPQNTRPRALRFEEITHSMPVPHIVSARPTVRRPVVRTPVTGRARIVTEIPAETDAFTTATGATTTGVGTTDNAVVPEDDGFIVEGRANGSEYPDPDAFIPVEHAPELIAMAAPAYPELARDAGIEGTVLVRALVGRDGFVHEVRILESVLTLDDAALAAARDAVFKPALQQDKPVAVWVVIPIEFRLRP